MPRPSPATAGGSTSARNGCAWSTWAARRSAPALGAPREYIFRVVEQLREITGLGLARAENLVEATQNADVFIEVSGILARLAGNLLKIADDMRLLSSGPHAGLGEIRLPPRQAGSSIMPGKVNPVIPEAVAQAAHGRDGPRPDDRAGGLGRQPGVEPLPAAGGRQPADHAGSVDGGVRHSAPGSAWMVSQADRRQCLRHVHNSTATLTALVERIGYDAAEHLAAHLSGSEGEEQQSLRHLVVDHGILSARSSTN